MGDGFWIAFDIIFVAFVLFGILRYLVDGEYRDRCRTKDEARYEKRQRRMSQSMMLSYHSQSRAGFSTGGGSSSGYSGGCSGHGGGGGCCCCGGR